MSTVRIISYTVVMWTSTCCHPKGFFTFTLAYLILGNTADNNLLVGQERTYLFITERSSEPRRVAFFIHCQRYLVHHIRILVICYGRVWAKSHRITSQGTFHNSKKSVRDNSSLSCDHNACRWTWSAHWKFGLKELEKSERGEKHDTVWLTYMHEFSQPLNILDLLLHCFPNHHSDF